MGPRVRGDDAEVRHTSAFSRRDASEFCCTSRHLKHQRAQGMPWARCTRSLACKNKIAHEVVTTGSPEQPGIPRAMVLTGSFVLSPVIGLCCHRHRQVTTCQLDASVEASGPHDFAVRVTCCSSKAPTRPPHPVPTSVTIAIRPSCGTGWRAYNFDLGQARTKMFLQMGLDRANQLDPLQQIRL
jgi:hypothetical protein